MLNSFFLALRIFSQTKDFNLIKIAPIVVCIGVNNRQQTTDSGIQFNNHFDRLAAVYNQLKPFGNIL